MAVKIGMVSMPELIDVIAEKLTFYNAKMWSWILSW